MAVSIYTVGINTADLGTWTANQAIQTLGIGMSLAGMHGSSISGLVVGISTMSGGGIVTNISSGDIIYQDVSATTTTGIGTGASFYVRREADKGGSIFTVNVNRPGYGYTGGEIVTISAEDIGGSGNGATDLSLRLVVDADISGGVSYAVTFTAGIGSYLSQGYDRNGYQGISSNITYTIKEGDTLTIQNNIGDEFSNYEFMVLSRVNRLSYASTEMIWSFGESFGNASQKSWTPSWGERGTYYFAKAGDNYGWGNYSLATVVVEPADSGSISTVSYGSTTDFISSNTNVGVLKMDINPSKKYGTTYHAIWTNGTQIYTNSSTGFFPINSAVRYANYVNGQGDTSNEYHGGHGYRLRGAGAQFLDVMGSSGDIFSSSHNTINTLVGSFVGLNYDTVQQISTLPISYATYELNLKVYKSSIDPNFVVFSWYLPTLSSTSLSDRTYGTFFLHKFESNVFDLNEVFLGTSTRIDRELSYNIPESSGQGPYVRLRTHLSGSRNQKRSALFGYMSATYDTNFTEDEYRTPIQNGTISASYNRFYYRPSSTDPHYTDHMTSNSGSIQDKVDLGASYNAVIKNIPLSSKLIPCPYYLPDDFALIQFDYNQVQANIQQGDTITISGSEVYTVIDGSYDTNQGNRTAGLLFCARTV
jgi:hypothetical protein